MRKGLKIGKDGLPKFDKFTRIEDFGIGLRGLGGLQTSHIRALKGSTFGAASTGRRLSAEERKQIEERMKREGKL